VHDTDEQPEICKNYNPYSCWYRASMTSMVTPDFMFVDRSRLEFLSAHVTFADNRDISGIPDWDQLLVSMAGIADDEPWEDAAPPTDAAYQQWRALVHMEQPHETPPSEPESTLAYTDNASPCDACSAPCCETLTFPQGLPGTRSSVDFYRFCLGFPGVELLVTDLGWSIAIKSRCRHLKDSRCSIFGQPERPLFCRY
jgi:hypothetical protein